MEGDQRYTGECRGCVKYRVGSVGSERRVADVTAYRLSAVGVPNLNVGYIRRERYRRTKFTATLG